MTQSQNHNNQSPVPNTPLPSLCHPTLPGRHTSAMLLSGSGLSSADLLKKDPEQWQDAVQQSILQAKSISQLICKYSISLESRHELAEEDSILRRGNKLPGAFKSTYARLEESVYKTRQQLQVPPPSPGSCEFRFCRPSCSTPRRQHCVLIAQHPALYTQTTKEVVQHSATNCGTCFFDKLFLDG